MVGGDEGSRIQKNIPTVRFGIRNPLKGMLDTREIGLGGEGEKIISIGIGVCPLFLKLLVGEAQIGQFNGELGDSRAARVGEFTEAVD